MASLETTGTRDESFTQQYAATKNDHQKQLVERSLAKLDESFVAEDDDGLGDENDDSFFMADLGEIYRQHGRWKRCLPRVMPFYGTRSYPFRLPSPWPLKSSSCEM